MFTLITLGIAAAIGVVGHTKTRSFVGKRLRFTKIVEKPTISVVAGLGTTAVVAAAAPIIPFVGAAAAIAAGIGVGTGVAMGSKDAKSPPLLED